MPSPHPDLEARILSYLAANPRAADTALGIAVHWLDLPPNATGIGAVLRALHALHARDLVRARAIAGDTVWSSPLGQDD